MSDQLYLEYFYSDLAWHTRRVQFWNKFGFSSSDLARSFVLTY